MDLRKLRDLLRRCAASPAEAERIAAELWPVAAEAEGDWARETEAMSPEVRAIPDGARGVLADALLAAGQDAGGNVLTLAAVIERGLPGRSGEARAKALAEAGRWYTLWEGERFLVLAEIACEEDRPIAPEAVAMFRRSATDAYGGERLQALAKALTEPVLNVGEAWAERALREAEEAPGWDALLRHALTARAARPTRAWEKRARALVEPLGEDRVRDAVLSWLPLAGRRTFALERQEWDHDVNGGYDPYNATALRGLVWTLGLLPARPDTARALGALVENALRKAAGLGPRNVKVANAAVNGLVGLDGEAALAELARLAARVTHKGTLKLLESVLEERAAALGLSREEIEELAVPAYGLTEVGRAEFALGETTALLEVRGAKAVLGWRTAAGKAVKSVPAAVRRDHAEELKELKAAVKDVDRMLSAQSERLDRQFLANRRWQYASWRERYLDHPLVGTLARRLLWTVDGTAVGYAEGELRTLAGDAVRDGGDVRLWHPVGHASAEVVAWRDWLERHAITQPFKQAHREVYLLTDAERATGTYSNRFAGHIVRQHQFNSLVAIRGWRNKLRLMVDDSAPPATRDLPQWGLRAEYRIHGEGRDFRADTTDSGSYLRLSTDQVRFYPIDAPQNWAPCWGGEYTMAMPRRGARVEPVPIADIPPLVLSEVLRDVDLFVGVASVGNDPTWQDGGPEGRYREYWTAYGFGELNQGAETRRALLERLVPRLAIADRCTLEGRFLHVRGERRTYRIHLGSGNILMAPDDQYLCIVPKSDPTAPQTGYLPFEGDRTLAVILSKAMLLAEDDKITDPTILSQLGAQR
ncbi:DUF4132 domain-containing protein [Kitasatospora sp. NPDC101183]|uniref:DUF4132 domain-containing protein n=1 Tax=Kitasatospora sp. NPDC101183 TaxID=3364100 RepID=UPI0037FFA501